MAVPTEARATARAAFGGRCGYCGVSPYSVQFLAQELDEAEASPALQGGQSYAVWSPDQAFAAAETLLQTLRTK